MKTIYTNPKLKSKIIIMTTDQNNKNPSIIEHKY